MRRRAVVTFFVALSELANSRHIIHQRSAGISLERASPTFCTMATQFRVLAALRASSQRWLMFSAVTLSSGRDIIRGVKPQQRQGGQYGDAV